MPLPSAEPLSQVATATKSSSVRCPGRLPITSGQTPPGRANGGAGRAGCPSGIAIRTRDFPVGRCRVTISQPKPKPLPPIKLTTYGPHAACALTLLYHPDRAQMQPAYARPLGVMKSHRFAAAGLLTARRAGSVLQCVRYEDLGPHSDAEATPVKFLF